MSVFDAEGSAVDARVAGFWIRFAARAIDTGFGFVVGVLAVITTVMLVVILGDPGPPEAWTRAMNSAPFTAALISFIGNLLYHTLAEYVGGASVGKLALGLRVVSEDFGPVSFLGALTRSAGVVVDGLFFGWIGYSAMEKSPLFQRHGDRWGRTAVVRARAFPEASRGAARALLGVLMGTFAWVTLISCLHVSRIMLGDS